MTVVRAPEGVRVGRALRWHAPPHLVMLAAMAAAMAPGTDATGHLIAALATGGTALVIAPFSRRHREVPGVLLDLGAMTVAFAGFGMATTAAGGLHRHGPDGILIAVIGTGVWMLARPAVTRGPVEIAGAALCGLQLGVMLVVALV